MLGRSIQVIGADGAWLQSVVAEDGIALAVNAAIARIRPADAAKRCIEWLSEILWSHIESVHLILYTELDSYGRFGSLRLFAEPFFDFGLRFEPIAFRGASALRCGGF